jgi:hypothetical protein
MRRLAIVVLLVLTASGCVVRAHGRVSPVGSLFMTGVAVAAVAHAVSVSTPPPATVEVGYYGYHRPGFVWVNGYHRWSGSAWVWTPGYYQAERAGYYWVQPAWELRGNQYVWVEGHWASPRAGHVYVDGYYDYRDTGYYWVPGRWEAERPNHVYVRGSWTMSNGRRTWHHGGWQPASATVRTQGGVHVRDHRR